MSERSERTPIPERSERTPIDERRSCAGYSLLRELGRGGMGVVYEAERPGLERRVALKLIEGPRADDPETRARFLREAQAAARLRHPALVSVYDCGHDGPRAWIAMELVEGESLEARLCADPRVAPRLLADWLHQIALGLEHAHEAGVVHRDVKPSNIIISADGRAKLADFGLALDSSADEQLTRTGVLLGTPTYMAPEQVGGSVDVDGRADIWALGITLYQGLAGEPPFRDESLPELLLAIRERPAPSLCVRKGTHPRREGRKVPADLAAICLQAIEKEPDRRYITAGAFAADLQRFREGRPVRARERGRLGRAWLWLRRRPVGLAAAVLSLGATLTLGAVLLQRAAGRERERRLEAARLQEERIEMLEREAKGRARRQAAEAALGHVGDLGARTGHADFARRALEVYDAAIAADGSFVRVLALRGQTFLRLGEHALAERDLSRAQELEPGDPVTRALLARLRLREGRGGAEGLAALETALAQAPGEARLEAERDYLCAARSCDQTERFLCPERDLAGLSASFWREGWTVLSAALESCLARDPLHLDARYRTAWLLVGRRDLVAAGAHLDHILELQPTYGPASRLRELLAQAEAQDASAPPDPGTGPDLEGLVALERELLVALAVGAAPDAGPSKTSEPDSPRHRLPRLFALDPREKQELCRIGVGPVGDDGRDPAWALTDRLRAQWWSRALEDPARRARLARPIRPSGETGIRLAQDLAWQLWLREERWLEGLGSLARAEDLALRAGRRYRAGSYLEAISDLRQALARAPTSGGLHYALATVLARAAAQDARLIPEALEVLALAARHGFKRWRQAGEDEDFAALRKNPRFRGLLEAGP